MVFQRLFQTVVNEFITDSRINMCLNLKSKLKFVKNRIKLWQADMRVVKSEQRKNFINHLCEIDKLVDEGVATDDLMNERLNTL